MFLEIRQYRTQPGQRDNWVKYMEEVIIPFQTATGMTILGSFIGQDEEDLYVWIRRFESEEQRVKQYADVYESDHWKNEIAPKIPDMMVREKVVVTRVEPTPNSTMK